MSQTFDGPLDHKYVLQSSLYRTGILNIRLRDRNGLMEYFLGNGSNSPRSSTRTGNLSRSLLEAVVVYADGTKAFFEVLNFFNHCR